MDILQAISIWLGNHTQELSINLCLGIIASVLTLVGDRWLAKRKLEYSLNAIAGEYFFVSNSRDAATEREVILIRHNRGRNFSISSTGGPYGEWSGSFVVNENNRERAHGIYRYLNYVDWGMHEFQIDIKKRQIYVYGQNQDKAGKKSQFSYILEKRPN